MTRQDFTAALFVFTRVLMQLEEKGELQPDVFVWARPGGYRRLGLEIVVERVDPDKGERGEVTAQHYTITMDRLRHAIAGEAVMHRIIRDMSRKVYEAATAPLALQEGDDDGGT